MAEQKPVGLYIHIPFCSRKCDYCDFVSYSMNEEAQKLYLKGLFAEIDMLKADYKDRVFDTIYIGGGTPSIMFNGFYKKLTHKLYSSFHFKPGFEFTIEVNPESFTDEKFYEYAEAGINRISVGLQCLDTKLLASHGRLQSVDNIKETFSILKQSHFDNISGDVMFGLPGQSNSSVLETVKFLVKHGAKHISLYSLQIERSTMLYDRMQRGEIEPISEEKQVDMYAKINKYLNKVGFRRYEVSNYCLPGYESKHNSKYWSGSEYLGLGVAAHSFFGGYRYFNTKRLDTYLDAMKEGKYAMYRKEYVSNSEKRIERIMLRLRTEQGLNLKEFKKEFDEDL
ncbi:MAG: radical SAM family heme chaperone HemW, partial [Clostridia bacterium]|nr:radical SAM family heme chaperone HemW [Clostridia bacterium]